ncbi:GNAT family N-acetyltransferase [Brevibacterium sp. 50QC2O2]|jgi:ribosomal protein S18 acetylase RimI-like enzyme|uniref:GNAT family N-acetyltransferase n=1 Tax=Brevibacterium TaxID=1696 RepID=UPI00211CF9EB|nr:MULTISPECIES: GNAT family N-acetyltransferase [unclassified Brevibacterium]MCQ9367683.1 GNAT family N-acetyltransferase [Brevibacterium sp. 91QC2O2]MCQ9385842.1 GNAT family N-acetyltransferase [Brevibacterium sp. 68QC2CO]MCQ9389421.1 GNAT family N-acetyltransferase [Brevibacterium sp. 50QC2O2]
MADTQTYDQSHLRISPLDEVDPTELRDFLVSTQKSFWGARDLTEDLDAYWVRQLGGSGLVARYQNEIVGYLLGVIPINGPAYIHLVAARDDFRHHGVGRQLYNRFIDDAKGLGKDEVQATAFQDNVGAISFHTSVGFEGELIANYAGQGIPRVLFTLGLNKDS